jgi:pSer/pThr/pTyr-binding forkhead associated (FHA) protein
MSATVLLTVTEGKLKGREFAFHERMLCTVGRASDCYLRLPGDEEHRTVSRRHCLLDVDPPAIRVRDLESLNGTYVNGVDIGHRGRRLKAKEVAAMDWPERSLKPGDELRVGDTVFRIDVIPDEDRFSSAEQGRAEQGALDAAVPEGRECELCC